MRKLSSLALGLLLCLGCGGSGGSNTPSDLAMAPPRDMAMGKDMAAVICCGKPGEKGNAIGVGKYCESLAECIDNPRAKLCATLGGDDRYRFCTFVCDPKADGGNICGDNASCQCDNGQCACTPSFCINPNPPAPMGCR